RRGPPHREGLRRRAPSAPILDRVRGDLRGRGGVAASSGPCPRAGRCGGAEHVRPRRRRRPRGGAFGGGRNAPARRRSDPRRARRRRSAGPRATWRSRPRGPMKVTVRTVLLHLEVPFAISRAVRTEKRVVLVEIEEAGRVARGEASPDGFFGETTESLEQQVRN